MHDLPRQKLRELIVQYGRSLCDDPRRCEALLRDYCGQYKREIFVLISALKNRVAEDLINASAGVPLTLVMGRLSQRLEDELGLAENAARWAVESWALALRSPANAEQPVRVFHDRLRDGSDGPAMIVIPVGEFWMGSPESEIGRYSNECQHRVKIEQPFAIGQYAVTFDEYDHFCAATVQWKPEDAGWGRGNRPVINVSWRDALDYTEWLSARTGQVYRLPTEAEWEYTARAGTETAFWWGDSITINQANYGRNHNGTVPVDRFQPNLWGLYQVHGNVWEWTSSCYDEDYGGTEMRYVSKNEVGPLAVRGGSWNNGSDRLRSAYRNRHTLTFRSFSIGFRLARSL